MAVVVAPLLTEILCGTYCEHQNAQKAKQHRVTLSKSASHSLSVSPFLLGAAEACRKSQHEPNDKDGNDAANHTRAQEEDLLLPAVVVVVAKGAIVRVEVGTVVDAGNDSAKH